MKTFIIYLVTRCFHNFNHPKTDSTPADELNIYADEKSEFEMALDSAADNVDVEILHEFQLSEADQHKRFDLAEKWYNGWEDMRKETATQHLFDDDGGDGVTEGDMSDNMLYAGTIG